MNNDIILEPHGGLANRMRVIASGLWLGRVMHKNIKLIWRQTPDLDCPFGEVFEPVAGIDLIKKQFRFRFFGSRKESMILKRMIILPVGAMVSGNYQVVEDPGVKKIRAGEMDVLAMAGERKILYFKTCEEFGVKTDEYKHFIPKPVIQQRIDDQIKKFNQHTIGVHIRRTDHLLAIKHSPTELFVDRIAGDLEKNPEYNYFLSTDDPPTEARFKKLFGHKIITLEKEFSRNSPAGIRDAVTDLFCLANTARIYGSHTSSFSILASKIRGIPLEQIRIF